MAITASGAYPLPNRLQMVLGNILLRASCYSPKYIMQIYLRRYKHYQTMLGRDRENTQGASVNKWNLIAATVNFAGRTVLDIGCAEGFFCLEALKCGAARVVGTDGDFRALLVASALARRAGMHPHFQMAAFPDMGLLEQFDCILCLSVLHHNLSRGVDMWTVLSSPKHAEDLAVLRQHLLVLRRLVRHGGQCVIEMPYQYSDEVPHGCVDFSRFCEELLLAGFATAIPAGLWDHASRNKERKDRMIYVAAVS